jgi:hypothetical protein
MAINKLWRLLTIAATDPTEFYDRLATAVEGRLDRMGPRPIYEPLDFSVVADALERFSGTDARNVLLETSLAEIEQQVRAACERLPVSAPFDLLYNSDFMLARTCYAICRALKPTVVLETGVAYGVTSAFILKALEVNGTGRLYSIDLPPLGPGADHYVGALVPDRLKQNWKLYRGKTRRLLATILSSLPKVDFFVHDSLHTYRNMLWELKSVGDQLARPAAVVADDIESNAAFQNWAREYGPNFNGAVCAGAKRNLFGVAVFASDKRLVPNDLESQLNS